MSILFINRNDRYEFARSLRRHLDEKKVDCILHVTHESEYSCMSDLDNVPGISFHVLPRLNAHDYDSWIIRFCDKHSVRFLFTSGDRDLLHLASLKARLNQGGTNVAVGEYKRLIAIMDKASHETVLAGRLWKIPRTLTLANANLSSIQRELGSFPYVVKPRNGTSSKDVEIVRSEPQLQSILSKGPDFVVQKYVSGTQYTVDVLSSDDCSRHIVAVRTRDLVLGSHSICTSSVSKPFLVSMASEFAASVRLPGLWSFQFIQCQDTEIVFVHDVNPRMAAGLPLSIHRGMPVFEWIAAAVEGHKLPLDSVELTSDLTMKIAQQYLIHRSH